VRPPERPDREPSRGRPAGHLTESLGEVLAWLDRHINLEAIERGRAGAAALPTLERIASLAQAMGEPERTFPIVHVTGTNGKGSTTRITSALLHANGLSVGTYTSPHLERLNERIAYNGAPISDDDLRDVLVAIKQLEGFVLDTHKEMLPPTWFELVTAAAFRHLADVAVDAAVIEVGIGGTYDATNIADAKVAVVTNIDYDHMNILGNTREAIATEKAGIIKEDSLAVVGEEDPAIVEIFRHRALDVGAEGIWRRGVEFDCTQNLVALGGRVISLRTPSSEYEDLFIPLYGAHQGLNASAAVAASEAFFGGPLDYDVVAEALARVDVPGRLEIMQRHPLVVLDGAHNVAGATALGAALAEDFAAVRRVVAVFGCLSGRDPAALVEAIGVERLAHVISCSPPSMRAIPADLAAKEIERLPVTVTVADSVALAIAEGKELAGRDGLVLVCGSLYLVGAAREHLSY
jgi:dihydrofolate synthase / folylpolyglutamate synthase